MLTRRREEVNVSILWMGVLFIIYGCSSVSLVILNKKVMERLYRARGLLFLQALSTIIIISLGNLFYMRYQKRRERNKLYPIKKNWLMELFKIQKVKFHHLRMAIYLAFLKTVLIYTGLKMLAHVNVATVVVSRSLCTFVIAIGEYIIFDMEFSYGQIISMVLIFIGASTFALYEINNNIEGYIWVCCNTLSVFINSLLENHAVQNLAQTPIGVSFYQNFFICVLLLANFVFVPSEVYGYVKDYLITSLPTKLMIFGSCFSAFFISSSYFYLQTFCSPTSVNIGSNMNKFFTVIISSFAFSGEPPTPKTGKVGLAICIFSGFFYTFSSANKKKKKVTDVKYPFQF